MRIPERIAAPLFVLAVVTAAVTLALVAQSLRPHPPELTVGIPLSLRIEGPGWTITYENAETLNNTAFEFLLEAAGAQSFSVEWTLWSPPYAAVFVDAINGARNGDGGRWWQFWVDGTYASLAADLTVLGDGSEVVWRFVPPEG